MPYKYGQMNAAKEKFKRVLINTSDYPRSRDYEEQNWSRLTMSSLVRKLNDLTWCAACGVQTYFAAVTRVTMGWIPTCSAVTTRVMHCGASARERSATTDRLLDIRSNYFSSLQPPPPSDRWLMFACWKRLMTSRKPSLAIDNLTLA